MRRYLIGLAVLCGAALADAAEAESPALNFGVLNQQSPALTAERWNPILVHVSAKAGVTLRLRMGPTVIDTNAMMANGAFDFAFTNHNFKPEYDGLGLVVLARWGRDPVRTAIVVASASPIRTVADLAGRRVAFPSVHAFLGYAVPRVALRNASVSVDEVFAGNQEGALAQLKAGRVDAISVNSRFLRDYSAREGVAFRTIFLSDPYPDLAVVAHPRVSEDVRGRVQAALVGMADAPDGAAILARALSPGFSRATDADYESVRLVYRRAAQ